jgi:hypothetical protein
MMPYTKSTTDDMADGQGPMLQPNHNVNVTTTLTKERELRPRSTGIDDMMAVPRATSLPTQTRATGPVSELWLQQNLLPRLSRRPYETHHYFQQRMTTDASPEDIPTGTTHTTQPESDRTSELPSQLSNGGKIRVSPREESYVGNTSTALHEYQQRLMVCASGSFKKPPPQDTLVESQTQIVPRTLFEARSPGSTVQDTEEEHKAAVELCLGSYRSSSTKKRKESSAHENSSTQSMPSSFLGSNADVTKHQPLKLDKGLKEMLESRYRDIENSHVIKYRGAFLSTGQIWCRVPGSWEDAVVLSNQRRT